MLDRFGTAVEPLLRNPLTDVMLGVGLLTTGLLELMEGIIAGFDSMVDAYNGVILFGLVTVMRSMLELQEANEVFAVAERDTEAAETARDSPASGA